MMIITGIIPARYASTRFPGKPLALINGKPMIRMVYEAASEVLDSLFVATDDIRIAEAVATFGGNAIITGPDHRSGTDRCAEALQILRDEHSLNPDVIVNIQGDEPFIRPEQILQITDCFNDSSVEIATLVRRIDNSDDLFNPNKPKVVISGNNDALFFSRAAIPYMRSVDREKWYLLHNYFKHIGLYGYRSDILLNLCMLEPSDLEIIESLEQLRWLSHGYKIRTIETGWDSMGIDTPEDLENAKVLLKKSTE